MTGEEARARWICCPMCDKEKCQRNKNAFISTTQMEETKLPP
jgi:hypothetical protein